MKISKIIVLLLVIAIIIVFSTGCGNNPPTNTTTVVGSGTAPLAPASLTVQVTSTSAITLSWPAVTGATSYNIYRSTFPSVTINPGNKINPNPVTQTMIQNSNLLSNTTYYYIVTSVSSGGESGPSAEVYAKPSTGLIGSTVGGINTNTNPITGIIYGTPNPATTALQIPLLGATVVANNNVTTTDMNGAYSVGTASNVVELSAAAQGYAAQTMAGVPAATVQHMHLNFLATPITRTLASSNNTGWGSKLTASTTVTVTVTVAGVASSGIPVFLITNDSRVKQLNAWNGDITNATGIATIEVDFYDGATSANIAVVAGQVTQTGNIGWNTPGWYNLSDFNWPWNTATTTLNSFGYVTANVTPAPATLPNLAINPVLSTPVTLSTLNMPLGTTYSVLMLDMPLPNGLHVPLSFASLNSTANLSFTTTYPNNIGGITQMHVVAYADDSGWVAQLNKWTSTLGSYIGNNYNIGNLTLTMPAVPAITSPTAVNSTLPTMITWNPYPGAAQYHAQISQGGGYGVAPTYEWDGFTTNTYITKPLFFPSNGGNLVPGYYELTLYIYPQANVGLGAGFPINPSMAAPPVPALANRGPQGFAVVPGSASTTQIYMDTFWNGFYGQGALKRVVLTAM